jgi:hypothetical protein
LTAPDTAKYRFFVRSDDASGFWLNTSGATLPDVFSTEAIARETDCCDAFLEPGVANDDGTTYAASEPAATVCW